LNATNAKIALVSSATAVSGACPSSPTIVDLVGYGTNSAVCAEGTATPALTATTAAIRNGAGCVDTNNNAADFTVATPTPRNSASPAVVCFQPTGPVQNETGSPLEVDFCNLQFPTSLNLTTGLPSATVYAQVYQDGVTPGAGAGANIVAQIGYGPPSVNPQYQSGWTWVATTYNTDVGNNDEYEASLTIPTAGSYRYTSRVSIDNGTTWTYCDVNGAGSNAGLSFETTQLPIATVTDP
jgi:hypothetical protein